MMGNYKILKSEIVIPGSDWAQQILNFETKKAQVEQSFEYGVIAGNNKKDLACLRKNLSFFRSLFHPFLFLIRFDILAFESFVFRCWFDCAGSLLVSLRFGAHHL